jgi:hypothetical protein
MSPDDISCRGDVKSKPKKKQRKQKKRNKLRSQSGPPIKRNRHGADELSSKLEKMEIDNKVSFIYHYPLFYVIESVDRY